MNIRCKIGTHSSNIVRVKGKKNLPKKGDKITGMPLSLYQSLGRDAIPYNWKTYFVSDYWEEDGERFYYLSL